MDNNGQKDSRFTWWIIVPVVLSYNEETHISSNLIHRNTWNQFATLTHLKNEDCSMSSEVMFVILFYEIRRKTSTSRATWAPRKTSRATANVGPNSYRNNITLDIDFPPPTHSLCRSLWRREAVTQLEIKLFWKLRFFFISVEYELRRWNPSTSVTKIYCWINLTMRRFSICTLYLCIWS